MTLRGSLADLGIIDLVQYPHTGRKTGVLIVASPQDDARLYYNEGKLVHAIMDGYAGLDVLTQIVDWNEGEFEFRSEMDTGETQTIEIDLHRAIMQALKLRDEMRLNDKQEVEEEPSQSLEELNETLRDFLKNTEYVLFSAILDSEGNSIASISNPDQDDKQFNELLENIQFLVTDPPRKGFIRAILEDASGTVVLCRISGERFLLVAADVDVKLGAVSMSVSRLADILRKE